MNSSKNIEIMSIFIIKNEKKNTNLNNYLFTKSKKK